MHVQTSVDQPQGRVFVPPGTLEPLDLQGHLLTMLATREDTGGRLSVFEARNRPSSIADRHIHHDAVKTSYILDGGYRWYIGDTSYEARAGSFVLVPRHVPHHFEVGPDGGRQLFIFTPAGMEHFFVEAVQGINEGREENDPFWNELYGRYDVEPVPIP